MNPSNFRPVNVEDFCGPAAKVARILDTKCGNLDGEPLKVLLYGSPGTGKTEIAKLICRRLVADRTEIEHYNGKMVRLDTVKGWMDCQGYDSLFGGYRVIHVDEVDCMTRDAQDLCLSFLDRMEGKRAFIATSNLQLDLLQERFQTRLQQFKVLNPPSEELAAWIAQRFDVPAAIAVRCSMSGNVRAALLDLQNWIDLKASEQPKAELKLFAA